MSDDSEHILKQNELSTSWNVYIGSLYSEQKMVYQAFCIWR